MYKYRVARNERITPSTILLTLHKDAQSRPFAFAPGQYAAISFVQRGRPTPARCFSIVSSPTDPDILQFSTRTKGRFTNALAGVPVGGEVIVRGAFGGFVFDSSRPSDTVLLAGGIGITPFMSMIQFASATQMKNKITLVFSCQTQDDIPFYNQITSLQSKNPNFNAVFVIGTGPTDKLSNQHVETGRISTELLDKLTASKYADKSFFICGPPPFMKAAVNMLRGRHTPGNNIITEAFSQGPNRQTGAIASWPLNVYSLGAVGLALGAAAIAVSDLLKALPPKALIESTNIAPILASTNTRQQDLDALVNNLAPQSVTAPESAAVQAANAAANAPTPTVSTPKSSGTAPSQPVQRAKVCTTTQSGITTCI